MLWVLAAAILILYPINLLSPLQLNTDSVAYLTMAINARDGLGFSFDSGEIRFNHYPWGYPVVVAAVDALHIASAAALTAINISGLGIAAWTAWLFGRRVFGLEERPALLCALLTLLSFVFVRQIARPVPEALFAGVFSLSLFVLYRSSEERSLKLWAGGVALAVLAVSFRLAAVTLAPVAVWALIFALPQKLSRTVQRRPILTGALLLLSAAVVVALGTRSGYFKEWLWVFDREGVLQTVWWNVNSKLMEWGEITTNAPLGTVPRWGYPFMAAVGTIGIVALCYSLLARGRRVHVLWVAILTYAGLMFIWPARDPRFWINLIPLASCCAVSLYLRFWKNLPIRIVGTAHLTAFVSLGLAALVYSACLSVSREFFLEHYTKRYLVDAYVAYFNGSKEEPDNLETQRELRVLRRFPQILHPERVDSEQEHPLSY